MIEGKPWVGAADGAKVKPDGLNFKAQSGNAPNDRAGLIGG